MRRRSLFLQMLFFLLAAPLLVPLALAPTGCGGSGDGGGTSNTGTVIPQPGWQITRETPVQAKRKWTILVYMNGANDLEEYGSLNMNQMEKVGSNDNINMVVQFKRMRSNQPYDDKSNGDWIGTRRYLVTKDNNESTVTSTILSRQEGDTNGDGITDVDMGNAQTLREFIDWGVQTFPADRYAIFLWNHGAGWRSRATPQSAKTRGFSYDDETDNHIDTIQLPAALELGGGRKWDLIAWDSSLMQILEVAYEIRNQGHWIVGSEESPPGPGYPYDRFISRLNANPNMDGRTFGEIIAEETLAHYGPNTNITQSVIDPTKLGAIAPALNNLGAALTAARGQWNNQIADAREGAESYSYYENKDLLDFLRLLKGSVNDAGVQGAVNQVESATRDAIVKNVRGTQHPRSNGLAAYLPSPFQYGRDDINQANGFGQRYVFLSLAKDAPNWQAFLAGAAAR